MAKKETLNMVRGGAKELGQKLREIDPKLLVIVTAGNPKAVKTLPAVPVGVLPASILGILSDGWEQESWHDVWTDSSGWTDVWGQSPGAEILSQVTGVIAEE
jgi:hypothetical protein